MEDYPEITSALNHMDAIDEAIKAINKLNRPEPQPKTWNITKEEIIEREEYAEFCMFMDDYNRENGHCES